MIALNYWPATGHISITFFFLFYSNWVISPASLVESCSLWKNKPFNWGYNLFFSLRQRKTVHGPLNRVDTCLRSKRLRKRIYKNNKEKKLKWIIIFVYLVYCCDFAFTTVLEQVDQEQKRGMKGEEFFLFSFFFFIFFILLFLSPSPPFAQNLHRKLLLRRLSRNGIKIYLRWRGYRACDKRITSFTPLVLPVWVQEGKTNSFSGVIEPMHLYPSSLGQ